MWVIGWALKSATKAALEDSKARKALKDRIASLEETMELMRGAHSEELAQREARIRAEMAARPLTSDEKKRLQADLKRIRQEKKVIKEDIEKLRDERFEIRREIEKQERRAFDRRRAINSYVQAQINIEREHFDVIASLRGEIVEPDLYGGLVTLRDTFKRHMELIEKVLSIDGRTVDGHVDAG